MQRKNFEFNRKVNFDMIQNLPNNGNKYLLLFDYCCDEISNSKQFKKIATAGRQMCLNTIYIKHNLFHQSKMGKRCRITKYTHIFVQVTERCFTYQRIK